MVDGGVGGGEWWLVVARSCGNHQKNSNNRAENRAGQP